MKRDMAAGLKRKRLEGHNMREQRSDNKKKKTKSSDCTPTLRRHTNLQWDYRRERVVAKREQIAITWRDMAPFVDSVPKHHSGLADVFLVPPETFTLENLTDVLTYEVWASHLSESERKLLSQFLPPGTGVEEVVQSLLAGDNLHFGNPFLQWSSLLCTGVLHPDNAIRAQKQFRACKSAYYSELNRYHNDMIELLRKWGELWTSCEDPEKSWSEGFIKHQQGSLTNFEGMAKVDPVPREEMPDKTLTSHSNSANNPCYIKISREQDLLLLIIEQHGDVLRSRSLNQGTEGNNACTVLPFAVSEEEESKRLHDWLTLANKDIPVAYNDLREKKLHRERWSISLEHELAGKKKFLTDKADAKSNLHNDLQEKAVDGTSEHHSISDKSDCDNDFSPNSTAQLEQFTSPNYQPEMGSMAPKNQVDGNMRKSLDNSLLHPQAFRKTVPPNHAWRPEPSIAVSQGISPEVGILDSLYQTKAESQMYKSSSSLQHIKSIEEHSYPVIGLHRDTTNQGAGEPVHSFLPNRSTVLSSCPQGHINSFTQCELQFHIGNGFNPDSGKSSTHFQEQKQLLEYMRRERELYMHHMVNNNEYFSGRHPIEHFPLVDRRGIPSLQSPMVGGAASQNWFPVERRGYDGWSGVHLPDVADQYAANYDNADGNPFRVMLPSHTSYETANSEQFSQANSFSGGAIQTHDNNYFCAPSLPNRSGGFDAVVPKINPTRRNSVLSVNSPQNDPYLHGITGNTFLIPRYQ
ncbi:putative nuclear factor related to kappa-B-binding protein [Dioscorea sansibarensis]